MLTVSGWPRVRVAKPDRRLTPAAGLAVVAEADRVLGVSGLLETGVGQVKQRARGASEAQVLMDMVCAQLADQDHLVGLDRRPADTVGSSLSPEAGVSSTTAAQIAARFTSELFWGIEEQAGVACRRLLTAVGPARRGVLLRSVTLDGDYTDIEVYGRKKQGAQHGYAGALQLRAGIVSWAEVGVPLVMDLLDGREDPRAGIVDRLTRAVNVLPDDVGEVRFRVDTGYFAEDVAEAFVDLGVRFAIGVRSSAKVFDLAAGLDERAWVDAVGMGGTQVAVMEYLPRSWTTNPVIAEARAQAKDPTKIACLVRRTRLEADKIPTACARR